MTRKGVLLLDAAVIAFAVALFFFWERLAVYLPECPIKEYLGIYCIGCGGTRFAYHLINFRFLIAFKNNPYLFLLGAYLFLLLVMLNISCFSRKRVHTFLANEKWLWFWAISGILFFILRNIPIPPFSYLTPMKYW